MKILWVNPNFLHPTNKGGQIRTLEIVRALHARHEIHYAALTQDPDSEGPARAYEYSTKSYAYPHAVPGKRSLAFAMQLAGGFLSEIPLAVSRFHSPQMTAGLAALIEKERFDRIVCDFLASAPHFSNPAQFILFQHNVETMIWRRHAENAIGPLQRAYLQMQARRMESYEGRICRAAGSIIAVSEVDVRTMRELFKIERVAAVPTGVNLGYFASPPHLPARPSKAADLVFVGSMDWMPNIDGVDFFAKSILPLIRQRKPDCSVAIVGRDPSPATLALAADDSRFFVTGTVPDVRPYLWHSKASIVPLRIGGGTRLKVYESMAAGVPVISTTIGAEGLTYHAPRDIRIADEPQAFADQCIELLEQDATRQAIAQAALKLVTENFSSESVANKFEELLIAGPEPN
jgi:glycosyltransferase involved in cell wall biosynthesis